MIRCTYFLISLSNQSLCKSFVNHDSGKADIPSLHPSKAPPTQAFESASPP